MKTWLLMLTLAMTGCASDPAPSSVAARADAPMRELAACDRFQGAVLILRGGRLEYSAGFGFADVERRVPFTPDTPMDGGSIATPLTAATLLMLARERRIDLDPPGVDAIIRFETAPQSGVTLSWDSVFVAPPPSVRE